MKGSEMEKILVLLILMTSCNIAGPKYDTSANKKTGSDGRHFTDGCKPLLADKYYYWPTEKSKDMFICNYEGRCKSLEMSEAQVKDGDFELIFSEDMYLCKILGGKDAD